LSAGLLTLGFRRVSEGIMLIPAVGWFFRVRDAQGNLQMPELLKRREEDSQP
jgi:hypothetical protein